MPSARPSQFRGASGILRDVDGTIVGLQFTDQNPLAGTGKPKPGQPKKPASDFHSLFAVLQVLVDGADAPSPQPIFVGSADDFGVTEDGMGLTGDGQLSKSSGWFIFLDKLVAAGFDENNFPDDDPNVADYSALVGARVRFNWQVNEKATKKYGKKKSADGKKEYSREDLIVTSYYGQVDVEQAAPAKKAGVSSTPPKSQAKPLGGKPAAAKKGAVDIARVASDNIILAVNGAKDKTMSKSKVSVKLLTQLGTETAELRQEVRSWAESDANLKNIEGITYDADTQMLSLTE